MHKLTSSIFCFLLVLTCAVYAQDEEPSAPAESVAADTTVAKEPIADTMAAENDTSAESVVPEGSAVAEPVEEVAASVDASAEVEAAPAETAVEQPAEPSTSAEPAEIAAAAPEQKPAALSRDQVAVMMGLKSPYPRYFPGGIYLRSSYAPSNGVDLGIGFLLPLSTSWPVSVGFEPFHLQIAAKDFQIVSDETLWIAAAGLVLGAMGPLFKDDSSSDTTAKAPESSEESGGSVASSILAVAVMIPVYAICGYLYVPVVPGSWLGIVDRSRLNTQLISEGFHKRSFTYINDVGLRLSPLASASGIVHGYLDGGIRFEKNFDADLKYKYFAQLGVSLSF